jgi:hypothetical protein
VSTSRLTGAVGAVTGAPLDPTVHYSPFLSPHFLYLSHRRRATQPLKVRKSQKIFFLPSITPKNTENFPNICPT